MADEEEDICDICFEVFKSPKLLPCRHTFCGLCLAECLKGASPQDREEFLVCPMCRTQCVLPPEGVHSFFNNYFIKDSDIFDRSVVIYQNHPKCNICKEKLLSDEDIVHRCEISSEITSSDDDDNTYDDTSFSFIMRFPLMKIRTKYKVDLKTALPLVTNNVDDALITCVRITSVNICYNVVNCSSSYRTYDAEGNEVGLGTIITPPMNITDLVYRKDDTVLFLTTDTVFLVNGSAVTVLAKIKEFSGQSMALFSDERIIVVGTVPSKPPQCDPEDDSQNKESIDTPKIGKIIIMTRDGKKILSDLSKENCDPSVVAVNPLTDVICMSDVALKRVSVFLPNGDVIGEFNLNDGHLRFLSFLRLQNDDHYGLAPAGVCFDPQGNILVVDQASASVMVLDGSGHFRGMLVTGAEGGFGRPFLIGCGPDGTIWVGDRGTLRVFQISTYINSL